MLIVMQQLPQAEPSSSKLFDWKWSWKDKQPWMVDWNLLWTTLVVSSVVIVFSAVGCEAVFYVFRRWRGSKTTSTQEKRFEDEKVLEKGLIEGSIQG